jgi:hypothetical protein
MNSKSDAELRAEFTSKKLDLLKAASFDWRHVDDYALRVLSVIAHHVNWKTERTILSDDKIVSLAGRHRQTAQTARRKLRYLGWLMWKRTRTANVYTLGFAKASAVLAAFKREQDKRQKANKDAGNEGKMSRQDDISQPTHEQSTRQKANEHTGNGAKMSRQHDISQDVIPGLHLEPEMSSQDSIEMSSQDSTYTYRGTPKEKKKEKESPDDAFEQWWRHYPKKVAKGQARKAYHGARRKGATEAELLSGVMRYAHERTDQDDKYTKYPATWLTGECWSDEPAASPARKGSHEDNIRRGLDMVPDDDAEISP